MSEPTRREILAGALKVGAGGLGLAALHRAVTRAGGTPPVGPAAPTPPRPAASRPAFDGYGPLRPVADPTTGDPLIKLPEGFRCHVLSPAGSPMSDGSPAPGLPDGMGCVGREDGKWVLLRNHERDSFRGPFSSDAPTYDRACGGGVTRLILDPADATLVAAEPGLTGTVRNCAGGLTPWGSWLTCEETLWGPGARPGVKRRHGYVFEVPAVGAATARPLRGLGRRFHEAAAVTPGGDAVYLTEDRMSAGFYRFRPETPRDLAGPGVLEMLAITGRPKAELRRGIRDGEALPVSWVPVPDPERAHSKAAPGDCLGNFTQGRTRGGAVFTRLEGAWFAGGKVFFTSTNGGASRGGQVWVYDHADATLTLEYQGRSNRQLSGPDNLVVSPRGGVLICEDGWGRAQRIQVLDSGGILTPLVENDLAATRNRPDLRESEFAGACFSPDGRWLFANLQKAGLTLAITGPWERGAA